MKELVFEGIDNVGKTSVSARVAELLRRDGNIVHIATPFHDSTVTGEELFDLFSAGPQTAARAIALLREAIDRSKTLALEANADYLLYDRHWMTAKIMAPKLDLDDIHPKTVLLVSGNRNLCDMTDDEPWSTVEELDRYQKAYKNLALCSFEQMLGVYVVQDPSVDISNVAQTIVWDERILR